MEGCHSEAEYNDHITNKLVESVDEKLGLQSSAPPRRCISKVPNKFKKFNVENIFKKFNEDLYGPRIFSIGPIHAGTSELQDMEQLKWSYALTFFYRLEDPITALKNCCKVIVELEKNARTYYAQDLRTLGKYQMAHILLLDGCFILELLLRNSNQLELKFKNKKVDLRDDPILNNHWMLETVQQDLALCENQIPLEVMEALIHVIDKDIPSARIADYALDFFGQVLNFKKGEVRINFTYEEAAGPRNSMHLLHILHKYYLPKSSITNPAGKNKCEFQLSAMKLYTAGIKFRKASTGHLLCIEFNEETGVIQIPQFSVNGLAGSIMRNLVAFEQCYFATTHHMMAYALLMKSLIRSSQDAKLLEQEGILKQVPAGSEDVLAYLESICTEIVPKDFYFDDLCKKVDKYHRSRWNMYRRSKAHMRVWWQDSKRTLKRDYFPNPCRTISFLAAFVVVVFTALQTFYAVRSYY